MLQVATWDVVVVGGGPAGAAFALELARSGRRVVLLERTKLAQHKVCGEFLSPETVALLAHLGIDVDAPGAMAIDRFRLVNGTRAAEIPLPFRARALSRHCLDEALLIAATQAGVEVLRGVRVNEIGSLSGAGVAKADGASWRGRTLAVATGKHNVRGVERRQGAMVGFKLHLDAPGAAGLLPSVVQLAFFRGGYLGSCLVEDGALSIGWVMEPELLRKIGGGWEAQREFLSAQSSYVAALLDGSQARFEKPVSTAAIPYGYLRREAIAPEIFALGDQLAVVPSFTGDGLAIALCSGIAAARAVIAGQTASVFQRDFVARLRPQFRLAAALGGLLETPMLCGATVAAAQLMPRVAATFVTATRLRGFEALTR